MINLGGVRLLKAPRSEIHHRKRTQASETRDPKHQRQDDGVTGKVATATTIFQSPVDQPLTPRMTTKSRALRETAVEGPNNAVIPPLQVPMTVLRDLHHTDQMGIPPRFGDRLTSPRSTHHCELNAAGAVQKRIGLVLGDAELATLG